MNFRKYIAEFIGTFFLMLVIVLAVGTNLGSLTPLAVCAVLVGMIYAGGHISGAHYNPAVTLSFCLQGGCKWSEAPGYILAQLAATIFAVFAGIYLVGEMEIKAAGIPTKTPEAFDFLAGTIAEFLGTFALVWVILNVAVAKGTRGNSFYGWAIGCIVMAGAYGFGSISGAAFNPAVAMGLMLVGLSNPANIGAFLLGQLSAAVLATFLFKYMERGTEH